MIKRKPRRSAEQWRELVAQYNLSDMSESQYCHAHDLTLVNLRKWRYKFKAEEASADQNITDTSNLGFGPIHITPSRMQTSMCLELPGGVLLHTNDIPPVEYLAQLTKAFGHGC